MNVHIYAHYTLVLGQDSEIHIHMGTLDFVRISVAKLISVQGWWSGDIGRNFLTQSVRSVVKILLSVKRNSLLNFCSMCISPLKTTRYVGRMCVSPLKTTRYVWPYVRLSTENNKHANNCVGR